MSPRPILTARWTELILLNFPVPISAIAPLVPSGTEPDLHDGQAYISIVGFRFDAVRFFGIPVSGHTRFPEINLRYYVRRTVDSEVRRGVVFVREIVPRRAVAITANRLYNENYITRPMRSTLHMQGPSLTPNDTIDYAWRSRRSRLSAPLWNRIAARVAAPLALPAPNSPEEFFVEHYWGYVRARDGTTREYQVVHDPWQVAPADNITWDCDLPATYGMPLADYLKQPPSSAIIAAGSPVQVHRGYRIP
jgi:uncharacterized protein YqjF (DUF2071 family)